MLFFVILIFMNSFYSKKLFLEANPVKSLNDLMVSRCGPVITGIAVGVLAPLAMMAMVLVDAGLF